MATEVKLPRLGQGMVDYLMGLAHASAGGDYAAQAKDFLARAADDQQAREPLHEAVAREPTSALAHRTLADHYYTAARRRAAAESPEAARPELLRAREHYEHALAAAPGDLLARGYYECVRALLGEEAAAAASRPDCAPVEPR